MSPHAAHSEARRIILELTRGLILLLTGLSEPQSLRDASDALARIFDSLVALLCDLQVKDSTPIAVVRYRELLKFMCISLAEVCGS